MLRVASAGQRIAASAVTAAAIKALATRRGYDRPMPSNRLRSAAGQRHPARRLRPGDGLRRAFTAVSRRFALADHATAAALVERIERLEDEIWTLRELAERHRSMVEASGDLILRCDADRMVVYANGAFAETFGLALADVVGHPLDSLLEQVGSAAEARERDDRGDRRLMTRQGPRWFALREMPVAQRRGDPAVSQAILSDVTERHAFETELKTARDLAEAASAAKSRFLALASHEIRTPLNGILGMADLLLDSALGPAERTYAQAVKTSGAALLALVDDVLDLARIEAGRIEIEPEPASVEAVVEEVSELLAPRAQAKGLEFAVYVGPSVAPELVFDPRRVRQVITNLAGNAIKFTEAGGVIVEVTAEDRAPVGARLRITVRDTGIGIADADRDRIFAEYEQAESGPARRYGGTGLGLAISRALVRRMDGEITVSSRPGHGSVFSAEIEVGRPRPDEAARRFGSDGRDRDGLPPPDGALRGLKVLVLSAATIEPPLILRRLRDLGASAALAADADAAVRLVGAARFDALLVDHRPDADAAERLAAIGPGGPPAAVLVTPSDRRELPRLRASGFLGHLVKPVRTPSLAKVAKALASGRPVESEAEGGPAPAAPGPRGPGLSVLVADDNEINALLTRAQLEHMGHRVETVGDGRAAVDRVLERRAAGAPFDAVLMDLHMPRLDGYGAIRAIRTAEAGSAVHSLVLALTADTTEATERAALAAGADARLVKPIDAASLAEWLAGAAARPSV